MLIISDLTYKIAGRALFENASARIVDRAKVGLIGRNGSGKTTLFRLISGEIVPESGSITLRKGVAIGQVAQEAPGSQTSLIDHVLAADAERSQLLAEADAATDPDRIAAIHARLTDIGAHSAEARAATVLAGLGFDTAAQARSCGDFSGGWRMRIALAAVLFRQPELLLLDEPTNYLDLEGTLWLENYLARYPHTVVIISHDRDLLNKSVGEILHLDRGDLHAYRGGYDQFDSQRRETQALRLKLKAKQEAQRRHMEAFVDRFRYKASKARQAQSRLKALQKLQPIAALIDEAVQPIRLPAPARSLAPPILRLENAAVGYRPQEPVLRRLNLRIDDDDRIGLLGQNGNGKSTLAKLLAGQLAPQSGTLTGAAKLKIAYFAQHQIDELIPAHSPVQHVAALMPDASEAQRRSAVAAMGLPTDRMDTPAENLSGGEKARLLLGIATFGGPNLIILDEPTNHLDVDSRETLIQALNDYGGAIILISHDRHLVEACADRLWLVADGTVRAYEGDLEDYRARILQTGGSSPNTAAKPATGSQVDRRRKAADLRRQMQPLRDRVKAAERRIEQLQTAIETLDRKLADGDLFTREPEKAAELAKERTTAARDLAATEEKWLTLSEELDTAMQAGA